MTEPAVIVPIRVTWASMMTAKVVRALSPSRLVLFVVAMLLLAFARSILAQSTFFGELAWIVPTLVGVRLTVMALSSWLDSNAARRFTGTLTFTNDDIALERADGTSQTFAWSWVLEASRAGPRTTLRVDERRGRALLFVSDPSRSDALEPMLRAHGKLR